MMSEIFPMTLSAGLIKRAFRVLISCIRVAGCGLKILLRIFKTPFLDGLDKQNSIKFCLASEKALLAGNLIILYSSEK